MRFFAQALFLFRNSGFTPPQASCQRTENQDTPTSAKSRVPHSSQIGYESLITVSRQQALTATNNDVLGNFATAINSLRADRGVLIFKSTRSLFQHLPAFRHHALHLNRDQPKSHCSKESNPRMSINSRKFRDDINGLRAWAVIAVILYHFGVSGFTGGFVGVDIFFAISGFLMTGIVVEGLERSKISTFSLIEFYMARARRILPALIVLCAVLLVVGWWVLTPLDYQMLGTHSVAGVSFLSNIQFWREAGYFDSQSHEKWLLHTWSLAVEWQFYIILPLILMAVWKWRPTRQAVTLVMLAGFVASLSLSIIITPLAPSAAFYMLPTRAWEMIAGGIVYLLANRLILTSAIRRLLETIGFALIIGSIIGFDSSSSWPGWRALVPVIGTLLILLAARSSSIWTGPAVTQWLGTRSYSLYLWHWPIVVALYYSDQQENSIAIVVGLALTLVLGNLSYHLVETPARRYLTNFDLRKNAAVLLSCAIAVTVAGLGVRLNHGVSGRLPAEVEAISLESKDSNPRRAECLLMAGSVSPSCTFGGKDLQAIVLGDSHANATVSAVAAAVPSPNGAVMEWSYSACPIIKGVHSAERKQCGEFVDWAIQKLKTIPSNIPVVIINRHAQYALGPNENTNGLSIPQVYFTKQYKTSEPAFLEEYARNLKDTACEIAKNHTVYLVRPIPEMGVDVPTRMARAALSGAQKEISISLAAYNQRQAFIWKAQDAAHDQCGVKILNPLSYLCSDGRCLGSKNNRPLYRDDDHLSESGNKVLVPMFSEVFEHTDSTPPKSLTTASSTH